MPGACGDRQAINFIFVATSGLRPGVNAACSVTRNNGHARDIIVRLPDINAKLRQQIFLGLLIPVPCVSSTSRASSLNSGSVLPFRQNRQWQ